MPRPCHRSAHARAGTAPSAARGAATRDLARRHNRAHARAPRMLTVPRRLRAAQANRGRREREGCRLGAARGRGQQADTHSASRWSVSEAQGPRGPDTRHRRARQHDRSARAAPHCLLPRAAHAASLSSSPTCTAQRAPARATFSECPWTFLSRSLRLERRTGPWLVRGPLNGWASASTAERSKEGVAPGRGPGGPWGTLAQRVRQRHAPRRTGALSGARRGPGRAHGAASVSASASARRARASRRGAAPRHDGWRRAHAPALGGVDPV